MLTADYERLGLRPGERLLDLGCGFGRHAYEGLRRGADVVAFDYSFDELVHTNGTFGAMSDNGEVPVGVAAGGVRGDAHHLPFADASFDRIIASEVLEHLPDDAAAVRELARVLRPGGTIAVTIPAWLSETVCWKLSEEYHAPITEGGHLRVYTEAHMRDLMRAAGLSPRGSHLAHGLHTPYWWLKCLVGPTNDTNPLVAAYHRLLVWDITDQPTVTRMLDRALSPIVGKSIAIYATKPAGMVSHVA
ncbi:MAG: methyltransferase domain-containing protein [Acidimicrobiales bacterium]|nr:methyltransferase domain-containing protein [Acidimicrobiales bacterium]